MRSKEVEEAINDLMFIVVTDIYDNEVRIDKTKVINGYNQSVGTVLDYIKELEQLPNKIRDKIKELEEQKANENDLRKFVAIGNQIEVLKSIIGE